MHIRAIQTPTAHTDLQPKRRTWPPPALKEASDVKRATPRRWRLVRDRLFAHLGCCILIIAMLVGARPSFAHGDDEITTGTLILEAPQGRLEAPRIHTDVAMHVSGIIASVEVRQQFHNPSDQWVEGVYAFPLPENSAVNELRMEVGERVIVGEVREKVQAQRMFEQARDTGRRATVVHQQRPNIFRTSVANIGPRETIVVSIAYLQILDQQSGRYSVRFPLTITPRYIPGVALESAAAATAETPVLALSASHDAHDVATVGDLQPPLAASDSQRQSVSFFVQLDAGTMIEDIASAYHAIEVNEASGAYQVKLASGSVATDRIILVGST